METKETKQPLRRRRWTKRKIPACVRLEAEQARQVNRLSAKLRISKNQVFIQAVDLFHRSVFEKKDPGGGGE